jgi:hypothetical protein
LLTLNTYGHVLPPLQEVWSRVADLLLVGHAAAVGDSLLFFTVNDVESGGDDE